VADKSATTIRLSPPMKIYLKKATTVLMRSQSDIVEDALSEYLEKRGLLSEYQLNLTKDKVYLVKTGNPSYIIEETYRNGVSPSALQNQYQGKLQANVRLVIQESE
jgi:predicted DNA-binding protein